MEAKSPHPHPSTSASSAPPDDRCVEQLKVLADATRLEVLRQLMAGPRHVGRLNESLGIEQSLLSHHLRVLREAGLVRAERDGKAVLYRLAPSVSAVPGAIHLGCCSLSFDRPRTTRTRKP